MRQRSRAHRQVQHIKGTLIYMIMYPLWSYAPKALDLSKNTHRSNLALRQRSRAHGQVQHIKGTRIYMIMYPFFSSPVYPWEDQFVVYVLNQNRPLSLPIVR